MPYVADGLTDEQKLALAARTQPPTQLADLFAAYVGQFPAADRPSFDALARRTRDCYARTSPERAWRFRDRLDRRLHDRYHDPVAWEVGGRGR
ncbi:MAG TPA: hypothetical protein VFW96_22030 [Thermomicrobiales bacterium]|nr:hypothetical protein [Thermomicrobiales bacterium]